MPGIARIPRNARHPRAAALALALLGGVTVPARPVAAQVPAAQPAARATVTPARVTPAQFASLRWLEGHWRGRMPDGSSFYERYTFVDDSTIQMSGFADSTLARERRGDRIVLRGGVVRYENVVAVRLHAAGVDFAAADGSHAFTWTREGKDRWTATIRGGRPVVYPLTRYVPPRRR